MLTYSTPERRNYMTRRKAIKAGALAAGLAPVALAQGPPRGVYQVERKSTTATAEAITVQVPAGSPRTAQMNGATVYCSVECEVVIERDGTAATTTAITPAKMNSGDAAVTATAYRSSNVGTANRTTARFIIVAGGSLSIPLTEHRLIAGENITIRTSHASGTVLINMQWTEY